MSSAHTDLTSPFLFVFFIIFSSYMMAVANFLVIILNRVVVVKMLVLFLTLEGKPLGFPPLGIMLAIDLSYMALIRLRYFIF